MESEALSYSWRYLINKPLQEMDEMLLCSCSLQSSGTSELSGKRRIFQRCTCRSDVCEKLLPLVQSCSLYNRNSVKCKPWRRKPLPLYSLQKIYFTTLWFKLLLINCFEGFTRVWSETTMVKMHLSHIFHWYLVFILLGGLSLPLTSGLEDSLYVSSSDRNQLPNQVIYQGSVFSYTIPERAFDCALDTFVVSETADRFLSNWLAYDDVKRLLYGVPSEKDIGTYNILVVALAKGERVRGHICGSKSFSITVMPLDEHLPISVYLGSGSHDESKQESVQSLPCTPGMQAVLGTVILSTDLQELNGHERIKVLLKMANHLNIISNKVRLFSGAVSHPMIQQLDSPALMAAGPGDGRFNKGPRSLLTWNVGCGAVRLEDATLARLESDAQDGTITTLLGFPVVGWHVTSGTQKSVVRRRFRRQVGGTPTPTPTMSGALPTQMSSISTSVIMSRSIISTKTVYSSSSTKKLSTSTVDLSSEMSKRTTLGPSRNSSVVSISKSPSVLVSTPVLSSFVPGTISTLAMSNSVLTLNRTTTGLLGSSMEETLVNRTSLIDQSQLATSSATLLLNATTGLVMSSTEDILVNRTSLISQSALAASTVTMSLNATTRLVMRSTEEASVNRTSLISPSVLTLSTVILSPNATTGFVMSSTETSSVNRTSLTYSSTLGSIVTLSPNKTRGIMMTSTETNVNRTSVISPSPLSTSTVSLSLSTTSGFVVSSAEATSVNMRSVISKSSLSPTSPNKTTTTILSTSAGFNLMTTPSSLLDTSVVPSNSSTVFVFKTPSRTLSSPVEFSSVNRTTLATSSLLTMVAPNVTSAMIITSVNSLLIPETHSLLGSSNRTAQVFSSSAVSSVSHHISSLVTTVSSMASPGITRLSPVATSAHSSAVVTNLSTPQTIATILTSRRVPISSYSSTVLGTVLSSFPYHSSSTLGLLSNTSTMISSSPVVSTTQLQSSLARSSILQSSMRTAQNLTANTVLATVVSTMQQSVTMLSSTILQSVSESSQVVITSGELQQSSIMTVSNATVSRNTTLQPSMFSGSTINIRSSVTSSPLTAKSSMLPNSTVVIDKSSLFTIATPAFSPTVTRGARSLSSSAATNQTLVPVTSVEPNESSVIASSTPHLQTTVFTLSTGFPVTPNMTSTFVFTRVFRTASQLTNSTKVVVTTTGSLSLVPNSSFHFVLSSTALPKTTRSSSFFPSSFFTSSVVPVLNSSVVSPQSSLLPGSDFASPTLVVSNSSNAMNGSGTSTVPASGSFTNKPALTTTIILRNTTVVVRSSVFLPSASTIVNFSSSLTITKTNLASRHTRTFSSADVNSSRVVFRDSSTVFETHSAISSISTERARNSTVLFSRLTPSSPLLSSISSIHLRNTTTPFSASQVISNFSSAPRTSSVLVNVTYSVKRTTGISSSTIQPPSSPFQSLTSALNMSAGPSPSSSVPPMMTGSTVALYSSHGTVVPFTSSALFTVSSGVSVSPSPTVNGSVSSLSSVDVSVTVTPSDTAKVTPGTTALSANSLVRSSNSTSGMASRKKLRSTFSLQRQSTADTLSIRSTVTPRNSTFVVPSSGTARITASVPASEVTQINSTAFTTRSVTPGSNVTSIFSSSGTAVFETSVTQTSLTNSSRPLFASSRNITIFTSSVTQTNPTLFSLKSFTVKVSPLVSVTRALSSDASPYISVLSSSTSPSSVVRPFPSRINVTSTVLPTVTVSVSSNLTLGVNLTTSHAANSSIDSSVITRTRFVNMTILLKSFPVTSLAVSRIVTTSAFISASSTTLNVTPSFHTGLVSRSLFVPTATLETSKDGSSSSSGIKTTTPSSTRSSVLLKTSATLSTAVPFVTTIALTSGSSATTRRIFTRSSTALIRTTKATIGKPSVFSALSRLVKTATKTTLLSATRRSSILTSTASAFGFSTLPSRSASSNISQTVTVTNITKSIAPTSTVAPVVPNSPPQVYNNIGRLTAAAGKAWYYKIPSDTFYDAEDHADTRNLTLSLSFVDGRIIPADFWLQFHNETQIIYGLPMSTHVPRGNNGEQLVLRARDSQGAETHDAFEVLVVELEIPLVQQLTVKFSNDFLAFSSNVSQRLLLLRKIADYYGDSDESVIRVSAFTSGSVIMTWSNDSLPTESCDEEKVNYVENKIFLPSGEIREEFGVALDGFPVESGSHRRLGVCNESNVVPPGTIAPLQRSSSEDGLWHKLVLVGVLVALVIIIIAIFLAWHFRRKRPKPYDREKRTYKKRKPIVLEPEIELKPISGKPIVLPDDDPSIPPSYLSETSLDKPPGNYSDEDEEDYGKRSPSVYNKPPPPTYLEPSESPPPPYILPPIYGSYC